MIRYVSTRGKAPPLSFEEVVLTGLATDGGLYLPDRIPQFSPQELAAMAALPYDALAMEVMAPFVGDAIAADDLRALIGNAYAGFRHSAIAPLKQIGHDAFLLELFHGPTLAFKDFALQFLGRILEYFLRRSGETLTVVGATSGDTGSAAIEGCRGRDSMRLFILHPKGRVSEVQRRQMTTVEDANVFNIALEGTFDDCQDIVKALFADAAFRGRHRLAAVNSINWARILAQVVYYFYAALALGAPARQASFCVPTGNFGDIYAGYIAQQMGLPIGRLIIATNRNDILARCLATGVYGMQSVIPSLSPSMDIQVSSNFERLLFDLHDRDGAAIGAMMQEFRARRTLTLAPQAHARLKAGFAAGSADDAETQATIATVLRETGELLDPHTAVGVAVSRKLGYAGIVTDGMPVVTLATAHPAKFPEAVLAACGVHPPLPAHLAHLLAGRERMQILPNDETAVKTYMENAL